MPALNFVKSGISITNQFILDFVKSGISITNQFTLDFDDHTF